MTLTKVIVTKNAEIPKVTKLNVQMILKTNEDWVFQMQFREHS